MSDLFQGSVSLCLYHTLLSSGDGYLSADFLLKGFIRRIMIHVIDSDGKQSSFHILFSSCSLLPPSYVEFYEPCHFELSFSFGKVITSNEPDPPLLRLETQPKILF